MFSILLGFILLPVFAQAVEAGGEFCQAVGHIQSVIYSIGGSIVVIGWIITGILYLTAAGGSRMETAKKSLIACVIGTVLVIIAGTSPTLLTNALEFTGTVPMCK